MVSLFLRAILEVKKSSRERQKSSFGGVLGVSWEGLGAAWGGFGCPWRCVGASWRILELSLVALNASGKGLGETWMRSGGVWGGPKPRFRGVWEGQNLPRNVSQTALKFKTFFEPKKLICFMNFIRPNLEKTLKKLTFLKDF